MNFQSILIVTYGRSGSTLLQGLLNTIPGCVVRGENANLFYSFFQAYQKLHSIGEHASAKSAEKPWYGAAAYDADSFLSAISGYAKQTLLGDSKPGGISCYGFKEIRYIELADDFEPYLNFLEDIFPNPAFVFNTRNHDNVCKSGWWANQEPYAVKKKLALIEKRFAEFSANHSNCYQISYEDVVGHNENLQGLYEFLGAEFKQESYHRVMTRRHSYDPRLEKIKPLDSGKGVSEKL